MSGTRIEDNRIVTIHYHLADEEGNQLDSSRNHEPLVYVHGHDMLLPALEKALIGKVAGDRVTVTVHPDEGYGHYQREQVIEVPRSRFKFSLVLGETVQAERPDGRTLPFKVVDLSDDNVTLDGNHPLAGKTVTFDITVQAVREASPDELAGLRRRIEQVMATR